MEKKILIIDDEFQIARVLKRSLASHHYDVRSASDGESGIELFQDFKPDLVITDLSMPEMNGIEVCRRLRQSSDVPIIVLSVKGDESIKVQALDAGADDYVTKPFGMNELLARVRVVLRRSSAASADEPVFAVGDFEVDLPNHAIFQKKSELKLTPKEFELLSLMIRKHGRVLTHRSLLAEVWGGNYVEQTEYLRVFIGNLRKKIEAEPSKPKYIVTEPWTGYRFDPSPSL